VVVAEVPNDETAAKMALGTAMQGNVRTTTMRAFGREEMDKIVGTYRRTRVSGRPTCVL